MTMKISGGSAPTPNGQEKSQLRLSAADWNPDLTPLNATELGKLLIEAKVSERSNTFLIGDIAIILRERDGRTFEQIAAEYDYGEGKIKDAYYTASTYYAKSMRNKKAASGKPLSASAYENARRCFDRFGKDIPDMTPEKALDIVATGGFVPKMGKTYEHGFTDRSAAVITFRDLAHEAQNKQAIKQAPLLAARNGKIINACHNRDCRDLVKELKDGSVKCLYLDPPFAQYCKQKDGSYPMNGSAKAIRNECDGNTEAEAIQVVCDLLKAAPKKMAKGGVLILCQAAMRLRIPISQAIDDNGWDEPVIVVWDKSKSQMGRIDAPYFLGMEFCYVIWRKGEKPVLHDNDSRNPVLTYEPIRLEILGIYRDPTKPKETHVFQKPENLCEYFIKRHTYEGELCADLFGCSGSFCIAANRLNRQWIYCERNKVNYDWGMRRISDAAATARKVVNE